MITSLTAIAVALLLLAGAAVFEHIYVAESFESFHEELTILYEKADDGNATGGDAEAVRTAWGPHPQPGGWRGVWERWGGGV